MQGKDGSEVDFHNTACPKCGCKKPKVWVHGHFQCVDCKCIADGDCCQGTEA